jgi:alanyl aminopeptidase
MSRTLVARTVLLLSTLICACGGGAPAPEPPPDEGTSSGGATVEAVLEPALDEGPPTGPLPEGVTPLRYALDLEVVPSREGFSGTVDVRVRLDRPTQRIWMHGVGIDVREAWVIPGLEGDLARGPFLTRPPSAADATWEASAHEGVNRLRIATPVGPGEVTIHLRYEARFDRQLKGLYRVDVGSDHYAFTQFEPTSARYAFPGFDEPRFKTPFDVVLRVPEGERGFANTRELEATPLEGGLRRIRFATTEPLPTYLVAMAVGPLEVVEAPPIPANDVRTTPLPFRGICPRGRGAEMRHAMAGTPAILASLERYTGVAYPYDKLDIVAVPDFASGAMENAGLVTFREQFLLLPETPSEDQRRAFTSIMAHELAHQWFGNLVTMPWWDDLWLNEAFATYMASRTVHDVAPEQNARMGAVASGHGAMGSDSLAAARRIRQPIESDHDIRNAFDGITYSKGAAVIAMFERFMGEDDFREGIRVYLGRHRFGTARAEDLLQALAEVAGTDVATPFLSFLDQPGVPVVRADVACGEGGNVVALSQERFVPLGSEASRDARWQVPVCVRWGRGRETGEVCTLLAAPTGRLELPRGACPDWVHPNADASGYYRFAMPADDLDALVTRGYASLTPRERLSLANNVRAMVGAGTMDADAFMRLAPRFAEDEERLVAIEPFGLLGHLVDDLADDTHREAARRWVGSLYARRFARLGWTSRRTDSGDQRLLRRDLANLLVRIARDPAITRRAAELGRGYVGRGTGRLPSDERVHVEVIEPELATLALVAAVNDAGPGQTVFFDHVERLAFTTEDGTLRQRLLGALATVEAEPLATRALSLTLDGRLRINELGIPMAGQAETPAGRARVLAWATEHLDGLRDRMATTRLGWVPWTFAGFCGAADRARVEALFAPHIAEWPGGPRNLAGTLEAIAMCAARRERQAPPVGRFLDAR